MKRRADPLPTLMPSSRTALRKRTNFTMTVTPAEADQESKKVARQGYAGLLWSKQFYNYFDSRMAVGRSGAASAAG